MKRLLLILNPNAGIRQARRMLPEIIGLFAEYDCLTTVCITAKRGDATDFARRFGGEMDLVVCAGGDGTLNETLTGLLGGGWDVPIGYIPAGSTNDFAAGLGLSSNILSAARDVMDGCEQRLDVGRFQNRFFSYTASFGAFTQAAYATPQNMKNMLGHMAYLLEGIRDLPSIRPRRVRLEANGEAYEGEYLFGAVCNSTSLGGVLKLDPGVVDMNDGLFEVMLIKAPTTAAELQEIITALANRRYESYMIDFVRASRMVFRPDPLMPWTLDGEYAEGGDEVTVENLHDAIRLMMPFLPGQG